MKNFLAVYTGTTEAMEKWKKLSEAEKKEREIAGFQGWVKWGEAHAKSIVTAGGPLGKTKKVNAKGISDIRNELAAYVIVQAESHEQAAKLFLNHPHFMIFPGDSVEIMECLPVPKM